MYWESFKTFFKIGIFTLGGGYAMIPLIEEEVVNRHRWVEKEEMLDLIAIAQSCPGVFAINIAIFIGYKLNKVRGALATTLGTALPSFLIILIIAMFFHQFEDNAVVAAMFRGIRRGGTDCRSHFQSGQACRAEQVHHLDSHRVGAGHLAAGRVAHLDYHRGRNRRVYIWQGDPLFCPRGDYKCR